ncbi:MAG: hypothetical protein HZB34_05340 [Nitrospirae bacterium]|nr:hypothetical protein [Nitrospirota bacterium]
MGGEWSPDHTIQMLMMNMNPAQFSISAALVVGSLFLSGVGHATQVQKEQDHGYVVAAETTPTSCAVTGKGRTRAFCENYSLLRSGALPTEKSQYLSTVIVTTVIALLMVITVMAWLSLALIAIAAWARRTPRKPVEHARTTLSFPRQEQQRSLWAFRPTLWNTVGVGWPGLAWLVGIVSLIWSIWFVWFI